MSLPLYALPMDFLSAPAQGVKLQKIDFAKTALPEYKSSYAVIIDNAFSKPECEALLKAAEATTNGTWEQAMINTGNGHQMLITDARDCGRIIWDDRALVAKIWDRVKYHVPEIMEIKEKANVTGNGPVARRETWGFSRLNERMRFLKYTKGQYFRPHCDGSYVTPNGEEISFYTLHLYLNASEPGKEIVGGATRFHSLSWDDEKYVDVDPKVGRVLVFQHRGLLHSGDEVAKGVKMTLRTDLMYEKVEEEK